MTGKKLNHRTNYVSHINNTGEKLWTICHKTRNKLLTILDSVPTFHDMLFTSQKCPQPLIMLIRQDAAILTPYL